MAEGLARELFGDKAEVSSAGLAAWDGDKASPQAIEVLSEYRVDLSNHRARRLSPELIAEADWVIPMTQAQEERLKMTFPQLSDKIRCLGSWGQAGRDISDPWMGSVSEYRRTAADIEELLHFLKMSMFESGE